MARKPRVTAHKIAEDVKIAPLIERNEDANPKLGRVEAASTYEQPRIVQAKIQNHSCPGKLSR
jgi:hypothetical protein